MTDPAELAANARETALDDLAGTPDSCFHDNSLSLIDIACQRSIDPLFVRLFHTRQMKPGFGQRLAVLRERAGFTQDKLAQRLTEAGIECAGRGTVSAWEKERNPMPIAAMAWLCSAAKVSADWVLFETDLAAQDGFERQLLSMFRSIDRDAQQSILATLNTIHRSQHPGASESNPFPTARPPNSVGA